MTPRQMIFAAVCAVACILAGLALTSHGRQRQADQHKGRADEHADQGRSADAAVEAGKPALLSDATEVAKLRKALSDLRQGRVRGAVPPPGAPVLIGVPAPGAAPEPLEPDLVEVVARQDDLIAAQDTQIKGLEAQVLLLTVARDHWRNAFEQERQRAELLELAIQAQRRAATATEWKTGFKGALAGAALAYVAARAQ